jgi:hypothetical protein
MDQNQFIYDVKNLYLDRHRGLKLWFFLNCIFLMSHMTAVISDVCN